MLKKQVSKYRLLYSEFGFSVAANEFILRVAGKLFGRKSLLWKLLSKRKYNKIEEILGKKFEDIIEKYEHCRMPEDKIAENANIWVYWAQGFEKAPSVVKECLNSIKKNCANHRVVEVSLENYEDYVRLPKVIVEKYKEGLISEAHFSDVLRFALLRAHGGIWMDATVFVSDEKALVSIHRYAFYTVKHNIGKDYLVCRGLWTTFFLASSKGNSFVAFVLECLVRYWSESESVIDYLFLDSIMCLAYDNILSVRKAVDSIPPNNESVFEAMYAFDRMDDPSVIKKLLEQTKINKLTYKVLHGQQETDMMKMVLSSLLLGA